MKKLEKMNFANLQKLSRKEMKSVMAGSGNFYDICSSIVCFMDLQCQQCYNSYGGTVCRSGRCLIH